MVSGRKLVLWGCLLGLRGQGIYSNFFVIGVCAPIIFYSAQCELMNNFYNAQGPGAWGRAGVVSTGISGSSFNCINYESCAEALKLD